MTFLESVTAKASKISEKFNSQSKRHLAVTGKDSEDILRSISEILKTDAPNSKRKELVETLVILPKLFEALPSEAKAVVIYLFAVKRLRGEVLMRTGGGNPILLVKAYATNLHDVSLEKIDVSLELVYKLVTKVNELTSVGGKEEDLKKNVDDTLNQSE